MIHFVLDPSPALAHAQHALMELVRQHLPERSCIASVRRYRLKRLNVAFSVRETADVLLPLGTADCGGLAAARDEQGMPRLTRFRHVLVPDDQWRDRLLADPALGFTSERLHLVGWPHAGEPAALRAATVLQELAQARLAAGTTRAERIPVF